MVSQELIKAQIEKLLSLMGIEGSVAIEEREGKLVFNIHTPDSSMLIGQYGGNLMAFQHLVRLLVKKSQPDETTILDFVLDVEDYRKSREAFLEELARQAAERVRQTKQTLVLKPMSSYDRFVMHSQIAKETDLISESTGEEPERRVVIKLKNPNPL